MPNRKYEFFSLLNRLDERSYLTNQTLLYCHKIQQAFLVAIRTGLGSFLTENILLLILELVEVFLLERCRNINCRRLLPVKDCDCKICSAKKGFCSACMCLVCLNFNCANNTCSWVGCDACLYWCHVCGIRRNLTKPGPILKGPSRTTEMQFYCLGCGRALEMFGFVKDMFVSCGKEWGEETLMKELDCVRKIFQGSEDLKGKELHVKANVLLTKLVRKMISRSDTFNFIVQLFSSFQETGNLGKDLLYPVEKVNNSKIEVENEAENRKKKAKIGTCLSLALPDVSLSLVGLNRVQDGDLPANQWPSRSIQENYGYSVGSHKRGSDQIRNCGEGTNLGIHTQRGSGYLKLLDNRDGGRALVVSRQRKLLRRIVSEPIPLMAQIVQQLGDKTVESIKEYLRNLIALPERRYEFISLQSRLDERSDLTNQTLLKCHKIQLEFLVAIRTGVGSLLSENTRLLTSELVEVFLLERCRNITCRRLLPVKDCGCKICSLKKGFCNECMCLVCRNFDCANNTCSWVGCDACLHWCHAVCGIRGNLIKPGPSLKGSSRTTEMQFYCLGCGHASEMFGFVKDVFISCAKEWGEETLMKELDCVRKIFQGSEDLKGKELHIKADILCTKLVTKMISPSDACNFIFQFFSSSIGLSDFSNVGSLGKCAVADLPASTSLIPKSSSYDMSSSSRQKDMRPVDPCPNDVIASFTAIKTIEDEWSAKRSKKDDVDSLGSVVRIKEAEA